MGKSPSPEKRLLKWGFAFSELEGFVRGKFVGKLECILATLDVRGLSPTEWQRKQILACRDVDLVNQWVRAAVTTSNVKSLLAMRGHKRRETQRRAA